MAAVTICSDFGAPPKIKSDTVSTVSPSICHEVMGSIKDRNGMGLTEAEDIKKKWQEYTEELYKKDLHDPLIMVMLSLI